MQFVNCSCSRCIHSKSSMWSPNGHFSYIQRTKLHNNIQIPVYRQLNKTPITNKRNITRVILYTTLIINLLIVEKCRNTSFSSLWPLLWWRKPAFLLKTPHHIWAKCSWIHHSGGYFVSERIHHRHLQQRILLHKWPLYLRSCWYRQKLLQLHRVA